MYTHIKDITNMVQYFTFVPCIKYKQTANYLILNKYLLCYSCKKEPLLI